MITDYNIRIIGEILCWQFVYNSSYFGSDVFVSGKAFHIQVNIEKWAFQKWDLLLVHSIGWLLLVLMGVKLRSI